MSMSDDRSTNWTLRPVAAERKAKRFTLDYGTWRAHIAAPGSRFEPEQTAEPRIIRLDSGSLRGCLVGNGEANGVKGGYCSGEDPRDANLWKPTIGGAR